MRKKVSVVLPVFNEEKYIKDCLISLDFQTFLPDEIIVVDDGSTDKSPEIISQYAKDYPSITFLRQQHSGPAKARNFGTRHAKGEILVLIDADMVCNRDYIKELVAPIKKGKEIATFTRSEYVGNLENRWAKFWDDVTFANKGRRMKRGQGEREKVFRVILASVFKKAGGYESFGSSDDASILEKIGKKAKAADKAICYHSNPSTISEVYSSAKWMGRDSKNKGLLRPFLIFNPIWSLVKSIAGSVRKGSLHYLLFRVTFDFGYFLGLFDINLKGVHYK